MIEENILKLVGRYLSHIMRGKKQLEFSWEMPHLYLREKTSLNLVRRYRTYIMRGKKTA
jgi:hypothetical protein